MSKNTPNYVVFNDPEHGWLRVKRVELIEMGLSEKISAHSYMLGENAYLEEDCDMRLFLEAKTARGEKFTISERHSKNPSKIRGYQTYKPTMPGPIAKAGDIVEVHGGPVPHARINCLQPLFAEDRHGKKYRLEKGMIGEVLADWPAES